MIRIYDASDFGRCLRQRRKENGLSQTEAAQLSGVSQRLWSELESGKRRQVGLETAIRMLQTMGADVAVMGRGRASAGAGG